MRNILDEPLFLALFNSPVPRIIVKADAPSFTILTSNDAHKAATNLVGKDILGKSVWEIFDPAESGGNGGELLKDALEDVQRTNKTVLMPPFRYDMVSEKALGMVEKWWQLEIMPVGGDIIKPEFLLVTTNDVSQEVFNRRSTAEREEALRDLNSQLEQRIIERTRELVLSEAKFRNLVEQSPVAIALLAGKNLIVDSINPEMLKIWGKSKDVVGKPILEALPEMEGQTYPEILREVFESGMPYYGNESAVRLFRNNKLDNAFFNFINFPVTNPGGKVEAIIVVANEVTDQVTARKRTEESEHRLHALVMSAHYPLMILKGPDWIVDIANQPLAHLWNKSLGEITGKPLMQILPELEGQPFPDLLRRVYSTGVAYGQEEEVLELNTSDGPRSKYISFYYDPLFDEKGVVTGIIVSANDITEHVISRRELEKAYEQLRLSKEAAQLGTFDMDLLADTMEWDERCRELFGISHTGQVSYEADFVPGLHHEDRDRITSIISKLFDRKISNGEYDVEYRTVGQEDKRVRWVRAKGKVFFDHEDQPIRFIGSVLDITEMKQDERRKNDFIGMASHELKTPLTSLKAHIQLLNRYSQNEGIFKSIPVLIQAEKQIKKMTSMINGFLNLSRLESGKLVVDFYHFDLVELIADEIADVKISFPDTNISFDSPSQLPVHADREKIGHVISNLLSNAIKYSEKEKNVEVSAFLKGDEVCVNVRDFGIGIAESDVQKLFSPYFRVASRSTKYISGFGIGLYLSYEIIQRHQGNIWAESTAGEGSVFGFCIPLERSAAK